MFESVLRRLAEHLELRKIPYMIMGGQAVLAYGVFRSTKDIDVTLGLGPEGVDAILNLLKDCGWKALPENPREFVSEMSVLPSIDPATKVRIDFIFSFSSYEQIAIARANRLNIQGVNVSYISPSDLVIQKVVAGRPQDLDDAKWLIRRNRALDLEEIRRWLQHFEEALSRPLTAEFEKLLQGS